MNNSCNNCSSYSCTQEEQYEEFIPYYQEYAIGEFFRVGNEVFKVVFAGEEPCVNCDFPEYIQCDTRCAKWDRYDRENVAFVLYDTIEENE